jgi:hypothetical protein
MDKTDAEPTISQDNPDRVAGKWSETLDASALAALPFDEWLAYGRSMFSFEGLTVEEIRRQAEEAIADEWWDRFYRGR